MDWTAFSTDFNLIELIWDASGRRLAARLYPPGNTQQLKQMLIAKGALLPQELLDNLELSMERQREATITKVSPKNRGYQQQSVLTDWLETYDCSYHMTTTSHQFSALCAMKTLFP
ncbi:transposable element Tcb2 transposase [Trichonephila clavipes]|nr:transposable element Tcb2 transposase [Trichonephila clavipes]